MYFSKGVKCNGKRRRFFGGAYSIAMSLRKKTGEGLREFLAPTTLRAHKTPLAVFRTSSPLDEPHPHWTNRTTGCPQPDQLISLHLAAKSRFWLLGAGHAKPKPQNRTGESTTTPAKPPSRYQVMATHPPGGAAEPPETKPKKTNLAHLPHLGTKTSRNSGRAAAGSCNHRLHRMFNCITRAYHFLVQCDIFQAGDRRNASNIFIN